MAFCFWPRATFEGRLIALALARAHDVLMEQNWDGADLQQIVSQAMEAFAQSGRNRLRVEGPAVYGAFSNDSGRANVSWVLRGRDPPVVSLRWQESGGPPVTAPTH